MFPEPNGRWRAVLTGITEPAQYFVRANRARSHRHQLDVVNTPKLTDVRFRLKMPDYTGRAPYEGPLPAAGLSGLVGTRVEVRAASNRPLSGGTIAIATAEGTRSIELAPVGTGAAEVTGAFELTAAGKFVLDVRDVDGTPSTEKLAGAIHLLPDESPFVRIVQPPATSLATPEATLPVNLIGEDDFGIGRIQLVRSLNDSRATAVDLELPRTPPLRFDTSVVLPLSAYGLSPGDVIKLFARIEDNDPAGPKAAESSVVTVQIISQAQFEKMLRARQGLEVLMSKYREARRRTESLADEAEPLQQALREMPDRELSPEGRQSLQRMAQRLRREAQQVRDSMRDQLPFDIDQNLLKELAALADDLEHEAEQLEQLAQQQALSPEEAARQLEQLIKQLRQRKADFDREATIPLEHLEKIFPLIEDESRFVQLYRMQRDLAERLSSLRGHDGEDNPQLKSRMRNLEAEQQKIRLGLAELMADIENHAQLLPAPEDVEDAELRAALDELRASSLKFVDDVRASGASAAMEDAEAGLAAFSGTQGHASAQQAADILEKFLQKMQSQQGLGNSARLCLRMQPKLSVALGATVEQLLAEAGSRRRRQWRQRLQHATQHARQYRPVRQSARPGPGGPARGSQERTDRRSGGAGQHHDPRALARQRRADPRRRSGRRRRRGRSAALPTARRGLFPTHRRRRSQSQMNATLSRTSALALALAVALSLTSRGGDVPAEQPNATSASASNAPAAPGARPGTEVVPEPKQVGGEPDGVVQVANLVYAGAKSSQCFADHFLAQAEKVSSISTSRRFHAVKLSSEEIYNFPLVIMTGEGSFILPEQERANLARYIRRGGFLLASAGCSSREWEQSFRKEMALVFTDAALTPLEMSHPVFHTVTDINEITLSHGNPTGKACRLEGISFGGRLGVLYSQDGLNDTQHTHGCCCCGGNEIVNCLDINVNVLAYALTY